ncbi:MAG: class I SAM-dependent methyltransferase [Ktedonobacteraceae bacterium]|nr:class I SAM-dependent methyltransferase [Ktedonobacteraceae bacterium]
MHSSIHHLHGKSGEAQAALTRGHVIDWGWRYDLMMWWSNFKLHGKWQELQQMIVDLAQLHAGETALDVGCGTGTLALEAYARVRPTGHVAGIDPGPRQIARAHSKAKRAGFPIDFQVGVIEQLAFPDQSFDVVLSTFMMHVLPDDLKRQGLFEIARVLKPGGRLLVVDTRRPEEHDQPGQPVHTGPWNSGVQDQPPLLQEAGFSQIESGMLETGETRLPEIGFVLGKRLS